MLRDWEAYTVRLLYIPEGGPDSWGRREKNVTWNGLMRSERSCGELPAWDQSDVSKWLLSEGIGIKIYVFCVRLTFGYWGLDSSVTSMSLMQRLMKTQPQSSNALLIISWCIIIFTHILIDPFKSCFGGFVFLKFPQYTYLLNVKSSFQYCVQRLQWCYL